MKLLKEIPFEKKMKLKYSEKKYWNQIC